MTLREFLTAFDRCTSAGWLDGEEALLLTATAEETSGPLVEFGSYQGRSAMLLAQLTEEVVCSLPFGRGAERYRIPRVLHCVDPWADGFHSTLSGDEIYRLFLGHLVELPNRGRNVVVHRRRVEDWDPRGLAGLNVPAGLVYCDGDHRYAGTKAQLAKALACYPQAIAAHDVNDAGEGLEVKRACLEVLGPWRERRGKLAVWGRP